MKIRSRLLVSAMGLPLLAGLSNAALADGGGLPTVIAQTNYNFDLDQFAGNIINLDAYLDQQLDLGVDGAGNSQLASNLGQTIGWGSTGGNANSMLNISDDMAVISQTLTNDIGNYLNQKTENWIDLSIGNDSDTRGLIEINGLSQIGYNATNVAGVNMTNTGNSWLQFTQTQEYPLSPTDGEDSRFNQIVDNWISGDVNNGDVIIDGQYTNADGDLVSSVQYGANAMNNAMIGNAGNLALMFNQSAGYGEDSDLNNYTEGGFQSRIENTISANAGNYSMPRAIMPVDPAIRNIDQVAIASVNTLSVFNDGTLTLKGDGEDAGGQLFNDGEENGFNGDYGFWANNYAVASTGDNLWGDYSDLVYRDYDSGHGDAVIDKLGQTVAVSVNTVSIAGTPAADGSVVPAGTTTLGIIDQYGNNQSFEQVYDSTYNDFDFGNSYSTLSPGYGDDYFTSNGDGSMNILGNVAFAMTGSGNARATDLDQVQALTVNSFSTTGDLAGASVASLDYSPNPDLVQTLSAGDDVWLDLENVGGAAVYDAGDAAASGSQTLSFALNTLSVEGEASGIFEQRVAGDGYGLDQVEINLGNNLFAASFNGRATIGDYQLNGQTVASPVNQTIVSTMNAMSFGSADNLAVSQNFDTDGWNDGSWIEQNSQNYAFASGTSAAVANINQVVLNRVNTISSINPATPN